MSFMSNPIAVISFLIDNLLDHLGIKKDKTLDIMRDVTSGAVSFEDKNSIRNFVSVIEEKRGRQDNLHQNVI